MWVLPPCYIASWFMVSLPSSCLQGRECYNVNPFSALGTRKIYYKSIVSPVGKRSETQWGRGENGGSDSQVYCILLQDQHAGLASLDNKGSMPHLLRLHEDLQYSFLSPAGKREAGKNFHDHLLVYLLAYVQG